MDAHEPIRQESAHAEAKSKHKTHLPIGSVIVADARCTEARCPRLYYFNLRDSPQHMQKQLKYMKGEYNKTSFEGLHPTLDPSSLKGLVKEDSEEAETKAQEIWEYLDEKCVSDNIFKPGSNRPMIDFSFTLFDADY